MELFDRHRDTFGGDGSDNFALPDLRGRIGRRSSGRLAAEHPREDRVDMLEMIGEVELRLDLGR